MQESKTLPRKPSTKSKPQKTGGPKGGNNGPKAVAHDSCSICMTSMPKTSNPATLYYCGMCSSFFHLRCLHLWISSSSRMVASGDASSCWRCPHCSHVAVDEGLPRALCYCGKYDVSRLGSNRGQGASSVGKNSEPRSCGSVCGKPLGLCGHS